MSQQRIAVVGAGIVGLSTAYALLKQGMKRVTVLEQMVVDHPRSMSRGISRLLRFEYGSDLFYSTMVRLSLKRWYELEKVARRPIFTRTGVLVLGREHDNETLASYRTLRDLGIAIERFPRGNCAHRFPQFNVEPYDVFTYSRDGGILHASTCLQTLKDLVRTLGGEIVENCRVTQIRHDDLLHPIRLQLSSGGECLAEKVVLAVGPWVHRLLGELHLPVRLTQQYLLYFTGLPANAFKVGNFPSFIADDLYGFPLYNTCTGEGPAWLKATSHRAGSPVDPDAVPVIDQNAVAFIKNRLCELLPDLLHADLVHVDACIYDMSQDEDFILDTVPGDPRVVFAAGMSGHAFKFGLLLGEMISSMLGGREPPVPLDRFRLNRFSLPAQMGKTSVA